MGEKQWQNATRAIHVGRIHDTFGSHEPAITQTSTFTFDTAEEGACAFGGESEKFVYTRVGNPMARMVEKKIAALDGAEACVLVSSGMAAVNLSVLAACEGSNAHVICSRTLYGGTDTAFSEVWPAYGIAFTFVDATDFRNVIRAIRPGTKAVFLETPANPTLEVTDIQKIASALSLTRIKLIVDNSFATPFNQRPLELGADVSVYSATKYLNGHGDVVLGAVTGSAEFIRSCRSLATTWGPTPDPFACWLLNRALYTFHLRMAQHNANAQEITAWLKQMPEVKKVNYPGFSGMISFELEGGLRAVKKFLNQIAADFKNDEEVIGLAVSLGFCSTIIESPALHTHSHMPAAARKEKGITNGLVRLSVGLEDPCDIRSALLSGFSALH